ncbi:hypothetical protein AB0D76_40585, partial [Streptomyces sp. NPDC048252]
HPPTHPPTHPRQLTPPPNTPTGPRTPTHTPTRTRTRTRTDTSVAVEDGAVIEPHHELTEQVHQLVRGVVLGIEGIGHGVEVDDGGRGRLEGCRIEGAKTSAV